MKASINKMQFILNFLFTCTIFVWFIFDFLRIIPSSLAPGTHLFFFEGAGMFVLGLLFGTNSKEPWLPLIPVMLMLAVMYGLLYRALFTVLGINLYLFGLFLFGHFLERNKKIVEVKKP